jgi:hypothetical protein
MGGVDSKVGEKGVSGTSASHAQLSEAEEEGCM